jgi:large subunit ribosomal protein L10
LKDNRTKIAAKPGDIATKDVIIPKGPTELPPGPAISTLQKIGIKASVQSGKITVLDNKTVCKVGEKITSDMVGVFSLLRIEPMEIGLDLVAAWEDEMIFDKSILDISVDDYLRDLQKCIQCGVNLSVNIGYPTKLTINMMLQKAFSEARTLCIDANILEKGFIDEILLKAVREAKNLEVKL